MRPASLFTIGSPFIAMANARALRLGSMTDEQLADHAWVMDHAGKRCTTVSVISVNRINLLRPQHIDERCQSSWLVSTTGIVEKVSRKERAPIL